MEKERDGRGGSGGGRGVEGGYIEEDDDRESDPESVMTVM